MCFIDDLGLSIILNAETDNGPQPPQNIGNGQKLLGQTTMSISSISVQYHVEHSDGVNCYVFDDANGFIEIKFWWSVGNKSYVHERKHVIDDKMIARELIGNVSSIGTEKSFDCIYQLKNLYISYASAHKKYLGAIIDIADYDDSNFSSATIRKLEGKTDMNFIESEIKRVKDECECKCQSSE
jgi:hypothetical protein